MILEAFLICLLALVLLVSVLRRDRLIFWLWHGVVVCMYFPFSNLQRGRVRAAGAAADHIECKSR